MIVHSKLHFVFLNFQVFFFFFILSIFLKTVMTVVSRMLRPGILFQMDVPANANDLSPMILLQRGFMRRVLSLAGYRTFRSSCLPHIESVQIYRKKGTMKNQPLQFL